MNIELKYVKQFFYSKVTLSITGKRNINPYSNISHIIYSKSVIYKRLIQVVHSSALYIINIKYSKSCLVRHIINCKALCKYAIIKEQNI